MASYFDQNQQGEENEKKDASDYFNRKRVKQLYRIRKKSTTANYKRTNHNIKILSIQRDSLRKRIKFKQAYQFYQDNQINLINEHYSENHRNQKSNQLGQVEQPNRYKRFNYKRVFYKKARNQKLSQLDLLDQVDQRVFHRKGGIQKLRRNRNSPFKKNIIRNLSHKSPKEKIKVNQTLKKKKLLLGGKVGAALYFKKVMLNRLRSVVDTDQNDATNVAMKLILVLTLLPIIILSLIATLSVASIAAIISAIITFVVNIINFIIALFTLTSHEMSLAQTYKFITELDHRTNTAIYQEVEEHQSNGYDVRLFVNGGRSNANDFLFYSNIASMLYYLDAVFEENHLSDRIVGPFGGTTVEQELTYMHDIYFNYDVNKEIGEVERTILIIDEETGEFREEPYIEEIKIANIEVSAQNFFEFLDDHPHLLNEEQAELIEGSEALEQYEELIEYEFLFGNNDVEILSRYGWQVGQDTYNDFITANGAGQEWLYAITDLRITEASNDRIVATAVNNRDRRFTFTNLKEVNVQAGNQPNRGDRIGVPNDELKIKIEEYNRHFLFWRSDWHNLNPSFHIDNLYYGFQTNLGQLNLGTGLMGDLINPPASVTQWRNEVLRAARQYGIEEYVNVLLAIIWVESGGDYLNTPDIMQSSESLTGQRGSITNPIQSINQGVRHFSEMLAMAHERGLSDLAALQAYNFGRSFLYHLSLEETNFSFYNAVNYAKVMSGEERVPYNNPIAFNRGFNWRYQFGNMFYVDLVMQHIFTEDNPIVDIAKNEIGYHNGDKYWRSHGFRSQIEWSALFVSWVASQSGHVERGIVLPNASAQAHLDWFISENNFEFARNDYIPRPGDIIFFDYDGTGTADHIGIVEEANTSMIMTIEGNVNNRVARRTYSLDDITILGYGLTN